MATETPGAKPSTSEMISFIETSGIFNTEVPVSDMLSLVQKISPLLPQQSHNAPITADSLDYFIHRGFVVIREM